MTEDLRRRRAGEAVVEDVPEDDFLVGELRDELLLRGAGVGVAGAGELAAESVAAEARALDLRGVAD